MSGFEHDLASLGPWIHHYGAAAVFVILTLESFGVPLPGESLLVTAAILAGRGEISLPGLVVAAWAGAVVGDNIGYLAGRTVGHRVLSRYGAKIGLNAVRLGKVEAVFARYGPVTVVFARFVNVLRQLNGVVAGIAKMDWRRFLIFNAIGGALWVAAWVSAGFFLGKHGGDIAGSMHEFGLLGPVAALAVLAAVLIYWRVRNAGHFRF
jgi:membrane protein DedA with SNARE-associated domain